MRALRYCPTCVRQLTVVDLQSVGGGQRTVLRCMLPCRYQEPLPEDIRMKLTGAPQFPGFEDQEK